MRQYTGQFPRKLNGTLCETFDETGILADFLEISNGTFCENRMRQYIDQFPRILNRILCETFDETVY